MQHLGVRQSPFGRNTKAFVLAITRRREVSRWLCLNSKILDGEISLLANVTNPRLKYCLHESMLTGLNVLGFVNSSRDKFDDGNRLSDRFLVVKKRHGAHVSSSSGCLNIGDVLAGRACSFRQYTTLTPVAPAKALALWRRTREGLIRRGGSPVDQSRKHYICGNYAVLMQRGFNIVSKGLHGGLVRSTVF